MEDKNGKHKAGEKNNSKDERTGWDIFKEYAESGSKTLCNAACFVAGTALGTLLFGRPKIAPR